MKGGYRPLATAALGLVVSSVILVAGFAAAVAGMYSLGLATGSIDAEHQRGAQIATLTYFRVVCFKGLLPHLMLVLVLLPGLRRVFPWVERSRMGWGVGLTLAAGAAYLLAVRVLLASSWSGWPALQMRSLSHQAATAALMTGAVVLAVLVTGFLVPGVRDAGER